MTDARHAPDHVIVLIAAPGKAELTDEVLAEAITLLGPFMPELRWLNEQGRTAAEIAFTPPPPSHFRPKSLHERLRHRLMGLPIDIAVLPLGGRRMEIFVTDLPESAPGADAIRRVMPETHFSAARPAEGEAEGEAGGKADGKKVLAAVHAAASLALFDHATLRVAFHADEEVNRAADAGIAHNDLTALLYLQGYRLEEFTPA